MIIVLIMQRPSSPTQSPGAIQTRTDPQLQFPFRVHPFTIASPETVSFGTTSALSLFLSPSLPPSHFLIKTPPLRHLQDGETACSSRKRIRSSPEMSSTRSPSRTKLSPSPVLPLLLSSSECYGEDETRRDGTKSEREKGTRRQSFI